jgi:hypothetical protein
MEIDLSWATFDQPLSLKEMVDRGNTVLLQKTFRRRSAQNVVTPKDFLELAPLSVRTQVQRVHKVLAKKTVSFVMRAQPQVRRHDPILTVTYFEKVDEDTCLGVLYVIPNQARSRAWLVLRLPDDYEENFLRYFTDEGLPWDPPIRSLTWGDVTQAFDVTQVSRGSVEFFEELIDDVVAWSRKMSCSVCGDYLSSDEYATELERLDLTPSVVRSKSGVLCGRHLAELWSRTGFTKEENDYLAEQMGVDRAVELGQLGVPMAFLRKLIYETSYPSRAGFEALLGEVTSRQIANRSKAEAEATACGNHLDSEDLRAWLHRARGRSKR